MSRFGARRLDIHQAGPIRGVLERYYPDWLPPEPGRGWLKTLCPAHDEATPSASVNYELGAVKCQACGFKGDAISIIRKEEGVDYATALRISEELADSDGVRHESEVPGKPGRGVPSVRPTFGHRAAGRQVQAGVRRRFGS
ncbi:CHC2 zinc finger domain-containing protein [Streptomyces sp. NPDC004732]|uniref:CHC2 zinc finger domain-containing protein n=1 Tax=Streptomyces sp. NPDC004732 TaxID=3154290 RepID=UPI0033AF3BBA